MFKKVKKISIRQRPTTQSDSESDSENEEGFLEKASKTRSNIEEAKELQKMRQRQHGVSVEDLAAVKSKRESVTKKNDPLKIETGGFVDMKALKKGDITEEIEEQIGTTFATETNRRDEDAQMLKYVEVEMAKRNGAADEEEDKIKFKNPEDALYELPEHLKAITNKNKRSEDMLSNQMLSGIPEVDLGIEAKIKNIEQTEDAKQKLIQEKMKKRNDDISLVPTNYAVNFVQHNRFNIEDSSSHLKRKAPPPAPAPAPVRVGDVERQDTDAPRPRKHHNDKATDDFYYDKFKKQMRRF